ncbi:MAG: carboxypeptidase-like regulatory domain-containing protein [Bacteroidia bacterium]|nr:carboxypeptidase-like regulatory domain-containing protein [Bacteroidia bacterium]
MIVKMIKWFCFISALLLANQGVTQNKIIGVVLDADTNDPIIGANVIVQGTGIGTISEWDGSFEFDTDQQYPLTLEISYIGYDDVVFSVESDKRLTITMEENSVLIEAVEVKGSRIADKQKESPLTIESLDLIAIKETPAADFYDGLGSLKGVDLTAASLGFKVVNTRGLTVPVQFDHYRS